MGLIFGFVRGWWGKDVFRYSGVTYLLLCVCFSSPYQYVNVCFPLVWCGVASTS